jgi:hypothetical protein
VADLGLPGSLVALANRSRCEAAQWSKRGELGFDPEQFSVEMADVRIGT